MIFRLSTSIFANCTYAVEPPCTERYARWCERSATQLMGSLLLDFYQYYSFSTFTLQSFSENAIPYAKTVYLLRL